MDDHAGHRERLKNRFLKNGFEGFSEHEMLELLLFFSIKRSNTNNLGHALIDHFGSLKNVLEAEIQDLVSINGIGEHSALLIKLAREVSKVYYTSSGKAKVSFKTVKNAVDYIVNLLYGSRDEMFYIFCLDMSYNLMHQEMICKGTIDELPVYPRKIVASAIKYNTNKVILAHNHPTGSAQPSIADIRCTEKIISALAGVDIDFLDHIIVADADYFSFQAHKIISDTNVDKDSAYLEQY